MKSLKSFFPGFALASSDFRKVTKDNATYLAALVPWINFIFLTECGEGNDFMPGLRFVNAEVYFETEDEYVWRVYKEKFQNEFSWLLDSTKEQFEKYFFNPGEMSQFKVETGKEFAYSKFRIKVKKIILVRSEPFVHQNALTESETVTKFNSLKGI